MLIFTNWNNYNIFFARNTFTFIVTADLTVTFICLFKEACNHVLTHKRQTKVVCTYVCRSHQLMFPVRADNWLQIRPSRDNEFLWHSLSHGEPEAVSTWLPPPTRSWKKENRIQWSQTIKRRKLCQEPGITQKKIRTFWNVIPILRVVNSRSWREDDGELLGSVRRKGEMGSYLRQYRTNRMNAWVSTTLFLIQAISFSVKCVWKPGFSDIFIFKSLPNDTRHRLLLKIP
jgi:hypothetical protein